MNVFASLCEAAGLHRCGVSCGLPAGGVALILVLVLGIVPLVFETDLPAVDVF